MDYRPEIDPAQAVDFPLERARIYHLDTGLYALKMARSRMPEEQPQAEVVVAPPTPEAPKQAVETEQLTASQNLAAIRAQIEREAA